MKRNENIDTEAIRRRLKDFRVSGMAEMLGSMETDGSLSNQSALSVLNSLTIQEDQIRKSRRAKRLSTKAELYYPSANVAGILREADRRMNMTLLDSLLSGNYIKNNQPVWILGSSGSGKTYISCVLGNQACLLQYSVAYYTTSGFFKACEQAEGQNMIHEFINALCKKNLIIFDDFLLTGVTFPQATYLFELLNHPIQPGKSRSLIVTSQLKEEEMKLRLSEISPALAEAIMSRLKAKRLLLEITGKDLRLDS